MDGTSRVVVVGAGVMGAWTALWLARRGHAVVAVDGYGAGNSLSSSGGETRITRSAHGRDDHYPRWQRRARDEWRVLEQRSGVQLFHPTGALWFAHRAHGFETESLETLDRLGIPAERWSAAQVASAYPGISGEGLAWALFEPEGGTLMARRGVATAVAEAVRLGAEARIALAEPPSEADASAGRLARLRLRSGDHIEADAFVFACGPWLPTLFSDVELAVTRQEVLFFGTPPGDARFDAQHAPAWVDFDRAFYGIPSIEGRGFKCAPDGPGPVVDPDLQERVVTPSSVETSRGLLRERFPALADQPVVESRVCQYESTADSHFLIDRHPAWSNVWIVGGGSGHGFKHGPTIGEYVAARLVGDAAVVAELAPPDDRFALRARQPGTGLRTMADAAHFIR